MKLLSPVDNGSCRLLNFIPEISSLRYTHVSFAMTFLSTKYAKYLWQLFFKIVIANQLFFWNF